MYDFIIAGAGAAGCVLAARLSDDPAARVLLLEAGPPDRRKEIRIPAAFPKLFKTEVDWNYDTQPEAGLRGRRLYWPRGKMLGGSSSMNAMMYVRGAPADYDEWASLGNAGWSWADVLPWFRRLEHCARGPADHRGCDGPLPVVDLRDPNPLTRAFVAAAQQAGLPRADDINSPACDGVDFTQVTQQRGARCSAADAYLKPSRRRPNLHVVTGAHVRRVVLEGRRAVGVEYSTSASTNVARATREIVVACGAVNSPQLLMLSGIGPARHLREAGITPVCDLPGAGLNLQDHLLVSVVVRCRQPVSLVAAESVRNLLRYLLLRRGMLTSNIAEALAFIRTTSGAPGPDCELMFGPAPFIDHGLMPPTEHGATIAVVLLLPESRGRITLASSNPLDPPRIEPNYLSDPEGRDLRVLLAGVKLAQRIFSMPAFEPFAGDPLRPAAGVHTDAALEAFIRDTAETCYHPVGTCRMGTDERAVVDPELRVRGIERLRVVDASVMPTIVRGHTQAATVMIAERAAALMRQRAAAGPEVLATDGTGSDAAAI